MANQNQLLLFRKDTHPNIAHLCDHIGKNLQHCHPWGQKQCDPTLKCHLLASIAATFAPSLFLQLPVCVSLFF